MHDVRVPLSGHPHAASPVVGKAHTSQLREEVQCDLLTVSTDRLEIAQRVLGFATRQIVAPCADYQSMVGCSLQVGGRAGAVRKGFTIGKAEARPLRVVQWFGRDHTRLHGDQSPMQWIAGLGVAFGGNQDLPGANRAPVALDDTRLNRVGAGMLKHANALRLDHTG